MDTDTDDITTAGLGNALTRDGQGQPTANLPMSGFRHTGVANGQARTDYASLGQAQDGLLDWSVDSGSGTAYVVVYTPVLTVLADGQLCYFRATNTNTVVAPTFAPNGLTAHPITKIGGVALALGDIEANQECILRYNFASTRWELLNPSNIVVNNSVATTGDVKLTLKTAADAGWLLFDDGTFGSATSGSSNSNSVLNLALFTLFFNNLSDTAAPLFTSTGSGTTRAGQGTAAAAWAANCRMSLTKTLGRAIGIAGAGSGLTSRALGQILGEETHLLTLGETPTGITAGGTTSLGGTVPIQFAGTSYGNGNANATAPTLSVMLVSNPVSSINSVTANVTSNNTGGGAHNNMPPMSYLNAMVKQ